MLVEGLPRATWGWASNSATWHFTMHDGDLLEASLPDVLNILSELGTPLRIEWASPSLGGEGAVVQEFEPSLDLASVIELALQVKPEDADMAHVFFGLKVLGLEGEPVNVANGLRLSFEQSQYTDGRLEGVLFFTVDVLAPRTSARFIDNSDLASLNRQRLADTLQELATRAESADASEPMLDFGYPEDDLESTKTDLLATWLHMDDSPKSPFRLGRLLTMRLTESERGELFSNFVEGKILQQRHHEYLAAATSSFWAGSDEALRREAEMVLAGLREVGRRLSISSWLELPLSVGEVIDRSTWQAPETDLLRIGMGQFLSMVNEEVTDDATARYLVGASHSCWLQPRSESQMLTGYLLGPLLGVSDEFDPLLALWALGGSLFVDDDRVLIVRDWR